MQKIYLIVLLFFTNLNSAETSKEFINSPYKKQALAQINSLKPNTITYKHYRNHYYSLINHNKKAIVIVTGIAEPAIKYWQLIKPLSQNYDLYFWDHVNQGASEDILPELDFKKVHIDEFNAYQSTLNHFIKEIKKSYSELNIISHSTGSHIMLKHLYLHPKSIDQHIAITPMVEIHKMFIPNWLSKIILKTFYKDTDWGPTQKDKNPDFSYFTHSKENFNNYQNLIIQHFPKQLSTGVTAGWLRQAIDSMAEVLTYDTSKITTKQLFITAGQDKIVKSKSSKKYCSQLPNCQHLTYSEGRHQLLLEKDPIRLDVYKVLLNFLTEK